MDKPTVGILIISHSGIGEALIKVAEKTFTQLPLSVGLLSVDDYPCPDSLVQKAKGMIESLCCGYGVLVLTDMFGSTPSNIAVKLTECCQHIRIVSGMNLPMLVRIFNYPTLNLEALTKKALGGGQAGIFECMPCQLESKVGKKITLEVYKTVPDNLPNHDQRQAKNDQLLYEVKHQIPHPNQQMSLIDHLNGHFNWAFGH